VTVGAARSTHAARRAAARSAVPAGLRGPEGWWEVEGVDAMRLIATVQAPEAERGGRKGPGGAVRGMVR
jgi:hypothetical protein